MCLVLEEGESVRVARKNILVKKWIRPIQNSNSWVPVLMSEIGKLEFNKVLKAKRLDSGMRLVDLERLRVEGVYPPYVESGFHSYRLFARFTPFFIGTKYYAVIPKGSEYAKGCASDIVSTQIIVFSSLLEYLKWKIQKKVL